MLHIPQSWKAFEPYLDAEYPRGIHVAPALPYLTSHKYPDGKLVAPDGLVYIAKSPSSLPAAIEYQNFIDQVPAGENVNQYEQLFVECFLADVYPDTTKLSLIAGLNVGDQVSIGDCLVTATYDKVFAERRGTLTMESSMLDILTTRVLEYLTSEAITLATLYSWLRKNKFFCQNFYLAGVQQEAGKF